MFNSLPTPTIIQLPQGSPEWLAYRLAKFNASESAAVLGLSPWQTPYQLWLQKTGRSEGGKASHAMLRGTELEPAARAAYEDHTGLVMQPLVLEAGRYSASLDGMTLDGDLVLEIKCPLRGTRSDLWQGVAVGQVPEHYVIQVQHQLMVSGAQSGHLWVFDGNQGILHEIARDDACMARIQAAWEALAAHLDTDTPPALTEADTVQRLDSEWSTAAKSFGEAKLLADQAADRLEAARQALLALAKHPKECGAGVAVTRYWRQGNVDYKKIPALKGLDLAAWRGKAREEVRVTVG